MEAWKEYFLSSRFWVSGMIIAVAAILWVVLKRYTARFMKKAHGSGKKATNVQVITTIVQYIIFAIAAIAVLEIHGVNVGAVAASLGIVGIIVGFALQDLLKDLIMGTNIVWDEFFSVGDVVSYKEIYGEIKSFNIKTTKILDLNTGNLFTVCNRNISEIEIVSEQLDIMIPLGYDVPAQHAREICREICRRAAALSPVKSCEFLGTDSFRDSNVNYLMRIKCDVMSKGLVLRAANAIIQDVLEENGLSIPYPQMDVHCDLAGKLDGK